MRVIEIDLFNTYTCNFCNRWFKSKEELILNPECNFLVFCSKKCEFRFIYNLIIKQEYSNENLRLLIKIIGKEPKEPEFNYNKGIFEVTKFYSKIGLSNITIIRQVDKTKKDLTNDLTIRQVDKTSPPIYIGGLSTVLSNQSRLDNFCHVNRLSNKII